jgi:rubrerythrin
MNTFAMNSRTHKVIKGFQKNELTEHLIYKKLAATIKNQQNKEVLGKIANDELSHHDFWKTYTNEEVTPNKLKIFYFFWIFI